MDTFSEIRDNSPDGDSMRYLFLLFLLTGVLVTGSCRGHDSADGDGDTDGDTDGDVDGDGDADGDADTDVDGDIAADGDTDPTDFHLTVRLQTGFRPQAVDVLEVVLYSCDPSSTLGDSVGVQAEDGITWEIRPGSVGDELHVELTGDYCEANMVEVSSDTFEIDVLFYGCRAELACNLSATVYWFDLDGAPQDIGFGTGLLELPVAPGAGTTVEVVCRPAYSWTCLTGCDASMSVCPGGVSDCGSGSFDCIEDCCVPSG
jgi:hypothetical protein